jgi:DNA-binding NarL/FixJ family response regulator
MLTAKWSFRQELRSAALAATTAAPVLVELASVWTDVTSGRQRVVDSFYCDDIAFMVLEERTPTAWFRLPGRRRNIGILERVLLGQAQKAIALDLDLAPSTVAFSVAESLQALGLTRRVCRVPTLLVAAAHAARATTDLRFARLERLEHARASYLVLSAPRPDVELGRLLSPAEYAVARLLVEGLSHAEIAASRRASARTIANQLATAFQKLGVSGRSELLCSVLRSARSYLRLGSEPAAFAREAEAGDREEGEGIFAARAADQPAPASV